MHDAAGLGKSRTGAGEVRDRFIAHRLRRWVLTLIPAGRILLSWMKFRLTYQGNDVRLGLGDHLIGRGADCTVRLCDRLVSRHHALLQVAEEVVAIQDLGSRNGLQVNGRQLTERRELVAGDQLRIGDVDLLLVAGTSPRANATTAREESARPYEMLLLLGRLADKALALGNAVEAERILTHHLDHLLARSRGEDRPDDQVVEQALHYASELAEHTGTAKWLNFVFELCAAVDAHAPEDVVERLYASARRIQQPELRALAHYIDVHRARKHDMTPRQRFVLGRTEGLFRLLQS